MKSRQFQSTDSTRNQSIVATVDYWCCNIICPGCYTVQLKKRAAAKNRYTLKSSRKRTPRALPLAYNALCMFLPDKALVHPSCLLCLPFNRFFGRFLANQLSSVVPPCAPYTNVDVRETPSTSRITHHATPATHVSACFAAAAQSSRIVG